MGFNFRINPETRDYELDASGSFVRDYTAQTPMVLQLLDERGAWWGNVQLGSRIKSRFRGRPPSSPAEALRADIIEALQPFVRSGRLRTFSVRVEDTSPLSAFVTAVDGDSQPVELSLQPVG
jgi:phage gp46-like protein